MSRAWTEPSDVIDRARTIWQRGTPLATVAASTEFAPIRIPIRGPAASERGARFDEVRAWLDRWRNVAPPVKVDWKIVNDRVLGKVQLPKAAYLDTVDDVARAAGRRKDLASFRRHVESTPEAFQHYMARRPIRVLDIGDDWPAVVAAAEWLEQNPNSGLYPRQIPAEGVHTKIVETYRRDISDMVVIPEHATITPGKEWFATRFGLATKPLRVRLRFLDPSLPGTPRYSDAEIPVTDAAAHPVEAQTILVVENEVSFLSLPPIPGAVAVLGKGNQIPAVLEHVPWLAKGPTIYWGDIDTWGFAILDRVRAASTDPAVVTSFLMDTDTLLIHKNAWVVEESPSAETLGHLTEPEAVLHSNLLRNTYGTAVRLEQERIPWGYVLHALQASLGRSH